jgi:cell division protein FtsX
MENRERFAFFAFVLLALAMVLIVSLATHGAIEAHRHPGIGD